MTKQAPTLIWLNGAFGSGKTSLARRLVAASRDAWLLDPEEIGFRLRRAMPGTADPDFQTLPLWRELVLESALAAAAEWPARFAIVPMALPEHDRFDAIVGELRRRGVAVHHFSLLATPDTLRRRLRWRLDWPRSRRWALDQMDRFEGLRGPEFAIQIETDGRSRDQVVRTVMAHLPPEVAGRFATLLTSSARV
jgi:hypothetical protein